MEVWKMFQDNEECGFDFNNYQALAQRTANRIKKKDKVINGLMGLNGEAGEAIDIMKKHLFQGHDLDKEKIMDELGDVLWYIAETCSGLGVTMEDLAKQNIEKLVKRYPDGFDSDKSIYREEDEKIYE